MPAAEVDYNQHFVTVTNSGKGGFLWDTGLVDTNNIGPSLTNGLIAFSRFKGAGQIGGIRLGMTMSDVVSVWGKPSQLYRYCGIGPRMYYNHGQVSLFYVSNRLAVIAFAGKQVGSLRFDNGLTGKMTSAEMVRLLGPALPAAPAEQSPYSGNFTYVENGVRLEFLFSKSRSNTSQLPADYLVYLSVKLPGLIPQRQPGI